jgi:hypothetical protein
MVSFALSDSGRYLGAVLSDGTLALYHLQHALSLAAQAAGSDVRCGVSCTSGPAADSSAWRGACAQDLPRLQSATGFGLGVPLGDAAPERDRPASTPAASSSDKAAMAALPLDGKYVAETRLCRGSAFWHERWGGDAGPSYSTDRNCCSYCVATASIRVRLLGAALVLVLKAPRQSATVCLSGVSCLCCPKTPTALPHWLACRPPSRLSR